MQVAVRFYLRGHRLGHITQTRLIYRMAEQQGRGRSNFMWDTTDTAQRYRHPGALTGSVQRQEHGHSYHGKVAMAATLLHETPASACRPAWEAYLGEDFIRPQA